MTDPNEIVPVELTERERDLLRAGLLEWGGPTRCTEELAVAMGFRGRRGLHVDGRRIAEQLRAGARLTRLDLLRALLATEFVFISSAVGSGWDWRSTVGVSDVETMQMLRDLQRKTTRHVRCLLGAGLGTR